MKKIFVALLVLLSICLIGCGKSKENSNIDVLEEKRINVELIQADDGEYYVPIEHLIIIKQHNLTYFAMYDKSTDTFLYDLLSSAIIPLKADLGLPGFPETVDVKTALEQSRVNIGGYEYTYLYHLTMVPEFTTAIEMLDDGKLYIKLSDLETLGREFLETK